MTDVMDLGCAVLRTTFFEQTMEALGYFGRAGIASAVALSLLGHGHFYDNPRSRKAGIALIVALLASTAVQSLSDTRFSCRVPNRAPAMVSLRDTRALRLVWRLF